MQEREAGLAIEQDFGDDEVGRGVDQRASFGEVARDLHVATFELSYGSGNGLAPDPIAVDDEGVQHRVPPRTVVCSA